ncbi:MAG TPA: DUF896 domain-containing protein [Syntrophomonas sp.]|nr:DUF896 domain-containing protein [Syntrophomonas sp.]
MITEAMVQRINELAAKKKSVGLTLAEQAEQKRLYKDYLASIREQVKVQLDAIEIVDEEHVCDDTCCHQHQGENHGRGHVHGPNCGHDHQHSPGCGHGHQHSPGCNHDKH